MPYPIQLGPVTDRMRKFFRIRGKTTFMLDEVVVPVTMIQDLTKGPYQAGVSPCAGSVEYPLDVGLASQVAIFLQDKPQTFTDVLDETFNNKTFSITWMEIWNRDIGGPDIVNGRLSLLSRETFVNPSVRVVQKELLAIQKQDGSLKVPVTIQAADASIAVPEENTIWHGGIVAPQSPQSLDNSARIYEPEPNVTIGKDDVMIFTVDDAVPHAYAFNVRGFYQEQAA